MRQESDANLTASIAFPSMIAPDLVASLFGLSGASVTASNELRALYGGLPGGITLFFALASARPAWHRSALVLQLCVFGGMAAARAISILVSGSPDPVAYIVHAGEGLGVALALLALRGEDPTATAS